MVLGVHVNREHFSWKALRVPPLRAGVIVRAVFEIKCEWPMQREGALQSARKKGEEKRNTLLLRTYENRECYVTLTLTEVFCVF